MYGFSKLMVAGLVAVVFGSGTASAQNVVRNSGNGFGNSVSVNAAPTFGGFGMFGFGMPQVNVVTGSGNGSFNRIDVQGGGLNVVKNSGNGTGNTINVGR